MSDEHRRVVGHRGAAGRAPENTRAAFRLGWELGADMVELDVRLTADGHPVVLHDATLDRTTNGTGPVAERTLAEIQALDAGARFGPAFAGERVPTLTEALVVDLSPSPSLVVNPSPVPSLGVNPSPGPSPKRGGELEPWSGGAAGDAGSTRWLIELKQGDGPPERLVERAMAAIEAAEAAAIVRLISFDESLLAEALRRAPSIPRGIISGSDAAFLLAVAERLKCVAVHAAGALLTPEFVAAAHAVGWAVNTWTLNSADQIRGAACLGVDEITSDFPDVAVAVLQEMGLRPDR
jgi:glycerophosphoryl diester phosphodiesterase